MPLVVPGVCRYAMNGRLTNNRAVVNIVDVLLDSGTGFTRDDVINGAATDIRNAWQQSVLDLLCANYTFESISWVDLNTADGAVGSKEPNGDLPKVGTVTANLAASPAVAMVAVKRGAGGRGTRPGRMFFTPVREDEIDERGNLSTSIVAAYQESLNSFFGDAFEPANPSFGITPVVVHQTEAGGVSYTGYGSLDLQRQTTTQRRRLKG